MYYYDNRNKGEVDFLIDDYDSLSVVPIEVKSGKDYTVHSALNNFVNNNDYHIQKGYVVSNERTIRQKVKSFTCQSITQCSFNEKGVDI